VHHEPLRPILADARPFRGVDLIYLDRVDRLNKIKEMNGLGALDA
jgi:hypothetical protein